MVWGVVSQLNVYLVLAGKLDETFDKLGAPTVIFWPVIHIDEQGLDLGEPFPEIFPALR